MEVVFINDASRLLELLDQAKKNWLANGVAPTALQELETVRQELDLPNALPGCLGVLALTYRHCLNAETSKFAVVLHEGVYNALVRGAFDYLSILYGQADDSGATDRKNELVKLMAELVPDPEIRQAFLRREAVGVSLVHDASIQLGYLHRRTPALVKLTALLRAEKASLPIARPDAFDDFMQTMDRLIAIGELAPNDK